MWRAFRNMDEIFIVGYLHSDATDALNYAKWRKGHEFTGALCLPEPHPWASSQLRTQVLLKARHIPAFCKLLIHLLLLEHFLSSVPPDSSCGWKNSLPPAWHPSTAFRVCCNTSPRCPAPNLGNSKWNIPFEGCSFLLVFLQRFCFHSKFKDWHA